MPDLIQDGNGEQRVAVCVLTYRRPEQLKLLLNSLCGLAFATLPQEIEILVIDNDVNESALPVCQTTVLPWPLRYFVEPRRGIAQARNAAVRQAEGTGWIAFLDDDEIAEPQWLEQLLRAQREYKADIVGGPVVPQYRSGVPKWIIQSGILVRERYRTGARPKMLGTGNVLIRRDVFRRIGQFNERFGLTGGEDSEFFLRARQAGLTMVWSDEAVAHESVGPSRASLGYVLRREYQDASMVACAEIARSPSAFTWLKRAAKATARIAQGVLTLPVALLFGMSSTARALQRTCVGIGTLGGLLGIVIEPYRNPQSEI